MKDSRQNFREIDYSELPNFPVSTVQSHKNKLSFGKVADKDILIMQGRFHLYEGYSPAQVNFPVRVFQELGIKILVLTNVAGGINLNYSPGDIMIIKDHINLTCTNPLTGPNEDSWGIRFPDMTQAYDKKLIDIARKTARKKNVSLKTGIYAGLIGPGLETCAETKYLKTIGSDAVGFSTVTEAIAGVHAGMKILGISLISNINKPDIPSETTVESIIETAGKSLKKLNLFLGNIIDKIEIE